MVRFSTMRSLAVLFVAVIAVAALAPRAHAADFFVETVSAIDGGSSPATASSAAKYAGNEIAIRCNYDARLKVCETGSTCVASATTGQFLDAAKTFPVCFPSGWGVAAIAPTDAGVSTACQFYQVTPRQTCP
jgi:hypothetical protein